MDETSIVLIVGTAYTIFTLIYFFLVRSGWTLVTDELFLHILSTYDN